MKKLLFILFLAVFLPMQAFAAVHVNGYYKKNGTYVAPHYRSSPDSNPYNNYSFPGNTNPYTGVTAGGNVDTYLKNYNSPSVPSYSSYTPSYTPSVPSLPSLPLLPSSGVSTYQQILQDLEQARVQRETKARQDAEDLRNQAQAKLQISQDAAVRHDKILMWVEQAKRPIAMEKLPYVSTKVTERVEKMTSSDSCESAFDNDIDTQQCVYYLLNTDAYKQKYSPVKQPVVVVSSQPSSSVTKQEPSKVSVSDLQKQIKDLQAMIEKLAKSKGK